MTIIRITDLHLRAIIGIFDWEREHKQDIVINVTIGYDARQAIATDDIKEALDYKTITKRIIREVEDSKFFLLERLTQHILDVVMNFSKVEFATVRVDKPTALRFAKSVSVELQAQK